MVINSCLKDETFSCTSGNQLRDFLYSYNCNQHNIFKLTLPVKYIMAEVGDTISFSGLIENMKACKRDMMRL